MSSLLDRMKSVSTIKMSNVLSKSAFFTDKDQTPTHFPILNVALSGRIDGGLTSGITVLAGPSKHFKSLAGLVLVQAYMQRYPEAVCLFYDSEFGITPDYIAANGIDTERVLHIPIEHIEQLKFDMVKRLEEIKRGDKVIVFMDSVGNLASKKEVEDAMDGKSVADMTRAKQMKSLFRIITPHFTTKDIPCVVVNHVYMEQCLAGDTMIKTENGLKPIAEICVGDMVYALNGVQRVTHTYGPADLPGAGKTFLELEFDDGTIVQCSDNHRFMIDSKEWVDAGDLTIGQRMRQPAAIVKDQYGARTLVAIKQVPEFGLYDITVENDHCFELSNGVIAHNSMFPKAIMSGGCLVADTMLQTPSGLKAVQEFKVGDEVLTKLGVRKVTHVWDPETLAEGTPECIEVQFSDGYTVTTSEQHPFLINSEWVEAKDLKPGVMCGSIVRANEPELVITSVRAVGALPVYDISVEVAEHYVLANGAVTHNTGIMYSSDTVIFFGKSQEKDGTELAGWTFTMNIEKSRRTKEKSRLPFTVMFEGGIQKWSGMLPIALELGWVKKPSNGWYSRVDQETGEIEAKKFREKETHSNEFWAPLITNKQFQEAVAARYSVSSGKLIVDEVDPTAILAD